MDYFLATSNAGKIKEFRRFGCVLPSKEVPDLIEPDADIHDIVAYKARNAGPGAIVEDTCLHIEDCPHHGNLIKFIEAHLDEYVGHRAVAEVGIGRNNGTHVEIYIGRVSGLIVDDRSNGQSFGFDGFFVPDGETKTLYEFAEEGRKDEFSARKIAYDKMVILNATHIVSAQNRPWTGRWQNTDVKRIPLPSAPSL